MLRLPRISALFRNLFRRQAADRDLDEELQAYLDQLTEEKMAAGWSPESARRAARLEVGGLEQVKEEVRAVRTGGLFSTFLQDLRFGFRLLRRNPGFTATAVVTLGLGIGATTAAFSVFDAVLNQPLPVEKPDELVLVTWQSEKTFVRSHHGYFVPQEGGLRSSGSFSYELVRSWRDRSDVLSALVATFPLGRVNVQTDSGPGLAEALLVSGNYFTALGIRPAAGRVLNTADDAVGGAAVVVLSYGYWQRQFGMSHEALGQTVQVNGQPFEIVGVAPPEFYGTVDFAGPPDAFFPLSQLGVLRPEMAGRFHDPDFWWLGVLGRLKPGVSRQQAEAALQGAFQAEVDRIVASHELAVRPQLKLKPGRQGHSEFRQRNADTLFYTLAVVGVLLLIACANLAGLLLAREGSRLREVAVRVAIGCSRPRLVRQFLTEGLALVGLGVAAGILVAVWLKDVLFAWLPVGSVPDRLAITLNLQVLAFAGVGGLVTMLLASLAPAIQATRLDPAPALRQSSASIMGGGLRQGLRKTIVVAQLALLFAVLVAGGLFLRSLQNLQATPAGFDARNLLAFRVDGSLSGYRGARLADMYDEIDRRVRQIPGVQSVGFNRHRLLGGTMSNTYVTFLGAGPSATPEVLHIHRIGGEFFAALGLTILQGRAADSRDRETSPPVAVVNEAVMRRYFGGRSPIGERFIFNEEEAPVEIVGVVGDAKYDSARDQAPPTIFLPARQALGALRDANFYVRTTGDPAAIAPLLRQAVLDVEPNLPVFDLTAQEEILWNATRDERQAAYLSFAVAIVALVLSAVGLFGLVSQWVAQRGRELGVRIALGAAPRNILALVMLMTVRVVAAGALLGLAIAYMTARVIRSQLFGVAAHDPWTYLGVSMLLVSISLLASWIPARQATRTDPMCALRAE